MSLSYRVWCALALTAACWLSIILLVLALSRLTDIARTFVHATAGAIDGEQPAGELPEG